MSEMKFALFGTGFWSRYQLAGWREVPGARCVALYNRTRRKAAALAAEFDVPAVYDEAEQLLVHEKPDFVDIVSDVNTHSQFVELAIMHRCPVICQKPLAPTLDDAQRMVQVANQAGVPLFVHENWRWQRPLRRLREILEDGRLGTIVRARIDYAHSFPVFDNQPFLKELKQFILTDIGTHILDVARFLFGEATRLCCQTRRIHSDIVGEDVATVMLCMDHDVTVTCNMSYASRWEFDRFPESFVAIEGTRGGVSLTAGYQLTVFDESGSHTETASPEFYDWADPAYALIHSSIVDCHRHLLGGLRCEHIVETTGADNLKTLALVYAAYESAESQRVVTIPCAE